MQGAFSSDLESGATVLKRYLNRQLKLIHASRSLGEFRKHFPHVCGPVVFHKEPMTAARGSALAHITIACELLLFVIKAGDAVTGNKGIRKLGLRSILSCVNTSFRYGMVSRSHAFNHVQSWLAVFGRPFALFRTVPHKFR